MGRKSKSRGGGGGGGRVTWLDSRSLAVKAEESLPRLTRSPLGFDL